MENRIRFLAFQMHLPFSRINSSRQPAIARIEIEFNTVPITGIPGVSAAAHSGKQPDHRGPICTTL
ncbi:MAG: hypothetical protein R3C26_00950 [Calditrichia bacterium]